MHAHLGRPCGMMLVRNCAKLVGERVFIISNVKKTFGLEKFPGFSDSIGDPLAQARVAYSCGPPGHSSGHTVAALSASFVGHRSFHTPFSIRRAAFVGTAFDDTRPYIYIYVSILRPNCVIKYKISRENNFSCISHSTLANGLHAWV